MKLYQYSNSPFARKVLIVAREHNLLDEIELITQLPKPFDDNLPVTASNPLAQVPTLVLDDGTSLYDSRVICEYLDSLARSRGKCAKLFFPPDGPKRWHALQLQSLADGILDAAITCLFELTLRPESERSEEWIDAQWAKVQRGFSHLDDEAKVGRLNGVEDMTIGEITVICAIGRFAKSRRNDKWEERWPNLARWAEGYAGREAFERTKPGLDSLQR
ncbi:hypothetical protein HDV00_011209 [Rhizophlyctis rosea]|nr:hypothetical protein HDV00_011209 [Rhizophlyctis rosea]